MRITKSIVWLAVIALAFTACKNNEKTTPSGLKYTVIRAGEGDVPEDGEYLILNMKYTDANDSVWVNTEEYGPLPIIKQDSVWAETKGGIQEIFIDLREGDSVHFNIKAEDLFSKSWKMPLPEDVDPEGEFEFMLGVHEVMDQGEFMQWQQKMAAKQAEKQLEKDLEIIDDYLAQNEIDAIETESGLHYVVTEEGTGDPIEPGDNVEVHYAGRILGGEYFDTSIKSVAEEQGLYNPRREPYEPFPLQVGAGRVIKGWDEGIALLKRGDKATLYIPSTLGYGPRGAGNTIVPNSILIFDVEIVNEEEQSE
ncbi:MAG: FKBP-type peptidyl-prolyl cis-trans isomerase [Fulvivirga sp.]|nr:FKBP-type peptidyl-prolyl cis-trans isomerase [Fulvivirga sp.]